VLDVYLPEMNGVELYEKLAATGRGLPVIMISGRNDAQTQHLLQRVNAVAVLPKPFDENLLLDAISRALALPHPLGAQS
jgi:two-component system, LuxR family, response regulator FixJ